MMHRKAIIVALVLAVGVTVSLLLPVVQWPNHAAIRNASGADLRDVRLVLYDIHGGAFLDREVPRMAPGESIEFRHNRNDLRAELRYAFSGEEKTYHERYIDLWRGEGWVFTVQPGGSVETGYAYPKATRGPN